MSRMYNVVVINERNGVKVRMNAAPVTHAEGCAWLSKITDLPWRRKQLEPISELWGGDPNCDHDERPAPGGGVGCSKCSAWFCY